jgi:Fic family protein
MNTINNDTNKNNFPAGLYEVPNLPKINMLLEKVDALHQQLQSAKEANPDLWSTIVTKLRVDWTYNSNGIEGSTLSRGETHFFLTEGLTVEGKPLKDFIDAQNHAEAIDFLHQVVANQRPVTQGLIKEINGLLLYGTKYTEAINEQGQRIKKKAHPGEYKKQPNHVVQADGSIHWYVEPLQVADQMEFLVQWLNDNIDLHHPAIISAIIHYNLVRIHAFDDGNGRGSRILMNLILMKKGFFPAVIRTEKKRFYLDALKQADEGDISPFIQFIAQELIQTQEQVITDLQSKPKQ